MHNDFSERGPTGPDNPKEEESYQKYLKLGGNITKEDWKSALKRAENTTVIDKERIAQAENIARIAGIELHNTGDTIDPIIILYGILRSDVRADGVERHHDGMGDEHIFAEALRMLGEVDSLKKLIKAYEVNPSMSFKYPEEEVRQEEEKKAA